MTSLKQLSKRLSKGEIIALAKQTLTNPDFLQKIIKQISSKDRKIQFQAMWILYDNCMSQKIKLNTSTIILLENLYLSSTNESIQRMTLSLICFSELSQNLNVALINQCFDCVINPKIKPSIQMFSVKYLYKIGLREPELLEELIRNVQELDLILFSKGSQSILKRLVDRKNIL